MAQSPSFRPSWRLDRGPLAFVWGLWLFGLWQLVGLVTKYGVDLPYYDEWDLVAPLLGEQPLTLKWLWSQHNEHRIFLPRLVYLAVEKVGRFDFGAGMYFNVVALAAAAAAAIVVARRRRGRCEYTDAIFPLIFLDFGQVENILWSFQICFVLGSTLSMAVLLLSMAPGRLSFRAGLAVGCCALAFPLLGGHGLPFAPPAAICALWAGWGLRDGTRRGWCKTLGVWALAAGSLVLTAFYFGELSSPARSSSQPYSSGHPGRGDEGSRHGSRRGDQDGLAGH